MDDLALPNRRQHLYELTAQNRSKDKWLLEVLRQNRVGDESFTVRVQGVPPMGYRGPAQLA